MRSARLMLAAAGVRLLALVGRRPRPPPIPFKLKIACTATSRLRLGDGRARRRHLRQARPRRRHDADRHQHQHSPGDRLQLDPDRRPDRDRLPAGRRRRARSRRDRRRLGDGPGPNGSIAAVARNGVDDQGRQDFVGKKVGAPGIGAFLDVLFRKWLIDKRRRSQEGELRRGDVPDPERRAEVRRRRRRADGRALHLAHQDRRQRHGRRPLRRRLNRTEPIIAYVSTRASPSSIPTSSRRSALRSRKRRRSSIPTATRRAESIAQVHQDAVDIVKLNRPERLRARSSKARDFTWWIEVMKQQDMLQGQIDVSKLVFP